MILLFAFITLFILIEIVILTDKNDGSAYFAIFPAGIIGGLFAGRAFGGFFDVCFGAVIGMSFGFLLTFALTRSKLFALLSALIMPAGASLAPIFLGGQLSIPRWLLAVLGAAAGALLCFLISFQDIKKETNKRNLAAAEAEKERLRVLEEERIENHKKAVIKKENDRRAKREQEAEIRRLEEIERNRPIEEKLLMLSNETQPIINNISNHLSNAKKEFKQMKEYYSKTPEALYETFNEGSDFLFKGSRLKELQTIAQYYGYRLCVSIDKAKLEYEKYNSNRKKALIFVDRLKDIYDKLTSKQKKSKIQDAAAYVQINNISVYIPDSLKYINDMSLEFGVERLESIGHFFEAFGELKGQYSGTTFLAAIGIDFAINLFDHLMERNDQLKWAIESCHDKIIKIEKDRLKADGVYQRSIEINRALEGTMSAYEKMFVDISNSLYPPGDDSKSRAAREQNKKNGGMYFTDDEADAVIQLRTTGQFLKNLVDMEF